MFFIKKAYAIDRISGASFGVRENIGHIYSIKDAFVWLVNLFLYLGWILMLIGIALSILKLIYEKYLNMEVGEENMTAFQQAVSKAVLITVSGIVLVCAGYILKVVGTFFGVSIPFGIPNQLR